MTHTDARTADLDDVLFALPAGWEIGEGGVVALEGDDAAFDAEVARVVVAFADKAGKSGKADDGESGGADDAQRRRGIAEKAAHESATGNPAGGMAALHEEMRKDHDRLTQAVADNLHKAHAEINKADDGPGKTKAREILYGQLRASQSELEKIRKGMAEVRGAIAAGGGTPPSDPYAPKPPEGTPAAGGASGVSGAPDAAPESGKAAKGKLHLPGGGSIDVSSGGPGGGTKLKVRDTGEKGANGGRMVKAKAGDLESAHKQIGEKLTKAAMAGKWGDSERHLAGVHKQLSAVLKAGGRSKGGEDGATPGKPEVGKPAEGKPAEGKSAEGKSAEGKPEVGKSGDPAAAAGDKTAQAPPAPADGSKAAAPDAPAGKASAGDPAAAGGGPKAKAEEPAKGRDRLIKKEVIDRNGTKSVRWVKPDETKATPEAGGKAEDAPGVPRAGAAADAPPQAPPAGPAAPPAAPAGGATAGGVPAGGAGADPAAGHERTQAAVKDALKPPAPAETPKRSRPKPEQSIEEQAKDVLPYRVRTGPDLSRTPTTAGGNVEGHQKMSRDAAKVQERVEGKMKFKGDGPNAMHEAVNQGVGAILGRPLTPGERSITDPGKSGTLAVRPDGSLVKVSDSGTWSAPDRFSAGVFTPSPASPAAAAPRPASGRPGDAPVRVSVTSSGGQYTAADARTGARLGGVYASRGTARLVGHAEANGCADSRLARDASSKEIVLQTKEKGGGWSERARYAAGDRGAAEKGLRNLLSADLKAAGVHPDRPPVKTPLSVGKPGKMRTPYGELHYATDAGGKPVGEMYVDKRTAAAATKAMEAGRTNHRLRNDGSGWTVETAKGGGWRLPRYFPADKQAAAEHLFRRRLREDERKADRADASGRKPRDKGKDKGDDKAKDKNGDRVKPDRREVKRPGTGSASPRDARRKLLAPERMTSEALNDVVAKAENPLRRWAGAVGSFAGGLIQAGYAAASDAFKAAAKSVGGLNARAAFASGMKQEADGARPPSGASGASGIAGVLGGLAGFFAARGMSKAADAGVGGGGPGGVSSSGRADPGPSVRVSGGGGGGGARASGGGGRGGAGKKGVCDQARMTSAADFWKKMQLGSMDTTGHGSGQSGSDGVWRSWNGTGAARGAAGFSEDDDGRDGPEEVPLSREQVESLGRHLFETMRGGMTAAVVNRPALIEAQEAHVAGLRRAAKASAGRTAGFALQPGDDAPTAFDVLAGRLRRAPGSLDAPEALSALRGLAAVLPVGLAEKSEAQDIELYPTRREAQARSDEMNADGVRGVLGFYDRSRALLVCSLAGDRHNFYHEFAHSIDHLLGDEEKAALTKELGGAMPENFARAFAAWCMRRRAGKAAAAAFERRRPALRAFLRRCGLSGGTPPAFAAGDASGGTGESGSGDDAGGAAFAFDVSQPRDGRGRWWREAAEAVEVHKEGLNRATADLDRLKEEAKAHRVYRLSYPDGRVRDFKDSLEAHAAKSAEPAASRPALSAALEATPAGDAVAVALSDARERQALHAAGVVAASRDEEAARRASRSAERDAAVEHVRSRFADAIVGVRPENAVAFRHAVVVATENLTLEAARRLSQNTRFLAFYDSTEELTRALAEASPQAAAKIAAGAKVGGSYSTGSRTLRLDGAVVAVDGRMAAADIYAHEFAHAIDGPQGAYSGDAAWKSAWAAELQSGRLSFYAGTSPSEGFAEFGRLAATRPPRELHAHYPACAAFWRRHDLIESPDASFGLDAVAAVPPDAAAESPLRLSELFDDGTDDGLHRVDFLAAGVAHARPAAFAIDIPSVTQHTDFACGAAVAVSLCVRYGLMPAEAADDDRAQEWAQAMMGTTPAGGTKPTALHGLFSALGLQCVAYKPMTDAELRAELDDGVPVVLAVQAGGDEGGYAADASGHYVVAFAWNDDGVRLYDPASGEERRLSWQQLADRWHDADCCGLSYRRWGLAVGACLPD